MKTNTKYRLTNTYSETYICLLAEWENIYAKNVTWKTMVNAEGWSLAYRFVENNERK